VTTGKGAIDKVKHAFAKNAVREVELMPLKDFRSRHERLFHRFEENLPKQEYSI